MLSCKAFLTSLGVLEVFRRVASFKEDCVIYKLFLEYNASHYVFISVFKSVIFILVLHDYVRTYLLERDLGRLGPRNMLRSYNEVLRMVISPWEF